MLRDFVFWTLGVLMAAGILLLARFLTTRRLSSVSPASLPMDEAPFSPAAAKSSPNSNAATSMISVLDEDGKVLIDVREGLGIPARAQRLPANESAIRHASQLAADLFKGAATLPNRTVEVVFKPEIQQGIRDGAYTLMQTRTGETLADAVDHTGQIVGKGRVVQTGHMQQLAVGAFQLASVAVAQAHLADIERSLQKLSGDLEKVLHAMETAARADLSGAISYLRNMADFLKGMSAPADMPMQLKNQIEALVLKSHVWRDKTVGDANDLVEHIRQQVDKDRVGKSATYKDMESHLASANLLLERRELLRGVFSLLNIVVACADPFRREFSRVDAGEQQWESCLRDLRDTLRSRASELFKKAYSESDDLLELRIESIQLRADELLRIGIEQKQWYESSMLKLESTVDMCFRSESGMRIALTFGNRGEVKEAAMI